jgi:FKBP-type peptidyl-prolyl cis-trans isomerase FklB
MNRYLLGAGVALFAVTAVSVWAQTSSAPAAATTTASAPASAFKTDKERMGYALGLQLGARLNGVDVDAGAMAAGIRDAATNTKPQLSDKEVDDALTMLQGQVMAQQAAIPDKNQKAGDAFLADNAKKDGVKTTASGLQYKVIKSGTGKTPKATDTVSVNYRGTLIDGKEFDASDKPVSFPVNGVIAGWTEALQIMKEGDKWQLFIPAKLAYGERGAGQSIGPNETLIFEVELLEVK